MKEIIAQGFGIVGFILSAMSFQEKNNKRFFIEQGLSGLMFFMNFMMIGAISAALFNITNLVRGALLAQNDHKGWRLLVIEGLYTACFIIALIPIFNDGFQIFLSSLTFASLVIMSVFMWLGNGAHIRYVQVTISSPAWLIHNVFNFSLGGIICEVLAMSSVVISFIRFGRDGFEKNEKKGEIIK